VRHEVPWGDGKHQLTKAYMQFLARWAPRPSTLPGTRCASPLSIGWGLQHRTLESIRALGVDEIQYTKGHKYLTLVDQVEQGFTRLLWVGSTSLAR
jgi:transposase